MHYLFMKATAKGAVSFPCDINELRYALDNVEPQDILERFPSHGHGPEWRMSSEYGVIVLDLSRHEAGRSGFNAPLTALELQAITAVLCKICKKEPVMDSVTDHCGGPDCIPF